jgi:hypothetical protein
VEEAIAVLEAEAGREAEMARAHAARSDQLEAALGQTREACFDRDRRIARLESALDLSRSEAESRLRVLAARGAELEALRVSSRGNATRIRLEALREAGAVSARIRDLGPHPEQATESLMLALERALDRIGDDWADEEARVESTEELARMSVPEPDGEIVITKTSAAHAPGAAPEPNAGADGNGRGPEAAASAATGRRVSIDVGPFQDFSQLVSFEDAANAIGATGEIAIRRFSGGRAEIDVDLHGPVDLIRELGHRCDLTFDVRTSEEDRIVLDLAE